MAQFRGIAYPFQQGSTSFPAGAEDDALIRMSILQILSTHQGERIMRPDFGANIYRFVFANNNDLLKDLVASEVRTAIGRFEPRVIVQDVVVQQDDNEITTTVFYIIRSTGQKQQVEHSEDAPR